MTTTDTALLPCPFCVGKTLTPFSSNFLSRSVWAVFCDTCQAEGPHGEDKDAVLNAWNTRPAAAPVEDDERLTGEEAWQELVEYTDRTSPEEYPDMCLITRDELIGFMKLAQPQG